MAMAGKAAVWAIVAAAVAMALLFMAAPAEAQACNVNGMLDAYNKCQRVVMNNRRSISDFASSCCRPLGLHSSSCFCKLAFPGFQKPILNLALRRCGQPLC